MFRTKILLSAVFITTLMILQSCSSKEESNIECINKADIFQFEKIELLGGVHQCFKNLLESDSDGAFDTLLNSSQPVSKAYGFWGKLERMESEQEKMDFLKSKLDETEKVSVKFNDVIYETNLAALYFDIASSSMSIEAKAKVKDHIKTSNYTHIDLENYPID